MDDSKVGENEVNTIRLVINFQVCPPLLNFQSSYFVKKKVPDYFNRSNVTIMNCCKLQVDTPNCQTISNHNVSVTTVGEDTAVNGCTWYSTTATQLHCSNLEPYTNYTVSVTARNNENYTSSNSTTVLTQELSE